MTDRYLFTLAPPALTPGVGAAPVEALRLDRARDLYMAANLSAVSPETIKWRGGKPDALGHWHGGMLQALIDYFGPDCDVRSITDDHLELYRTALTVKPKQPGNKQKKQGKKTLSVWSVDGHLRAAKSFFKWLAKRGKIGVNPALEVARPPLPKRVKRGVSDSAMTAMYAEAEKLEDPLFQKRALALLRLFDATAARLGGMTDLRLEDINWDKRQLLIRAKGDEEYVVFFKDKAEKALRAWLEVRPAQPGVTHVFTSLQLGKKRGRALGSSGIAQIVSDLKLAAGVTEPASPHKIRHRRLRKLVAAHMPLSLVADIANHKSVTTTRDFYGRLAVDELQESYNRVMEE